MRLQQKTNYKRNLTKALIKQKICLENRKFIFSIF